MRLTRREFSKLAAASPLLSQPSSGPPEDAGGLTDVPGIRVGHFTEVRRPTGCTVVLTDRPAVAGVDVRGSAPGTRETDLLSPVNTVDRIDAVLLSGGSAFGLDAAGGVVRFLEERARGWETSAGRVPIVPAAILFDLALGDASIRPDAAAGYEACRSASSGAMREGNVGAGTGASVGKLLGMDRAMKGGLGTVALKVDSLVVAALAAVNCVGDVRDPETGDILAGARNEAGDGFADLRRLLRSRNLTVAARSGENTTLAVVATNAAFSKAGMTKIAQMTHDGFARAINPVHLPSDGDTVFALSLGEETAFSLSQVGALAAEAAAAAIARAVRSATSLPKLPAHRDFRPRD
jgi:L-aminopeptidase/D-esterase-like protein